VHGWLTERYLRAGNEAPAQPRASVWSGRDECLRALATPTAPREPGVARFMSYNLRWFPDGMPGKRAGEHPTDIEWLACAIAASRVDVVLLQEIKTTPRARQALGALVAALNRHTGGSFETHLDPCPIETSQHVGLLYGTARTRASHFQTYAGLNPHGEPCRDQLRPGFGGYFEFPGGLDLHVVSVHFKSGPQRRDHELRLRSLAGLGGVIAQATGARVDDDIVVGGDLNTMGCRHCSPAISAGAELELFRTRLAAGTPPWSLVASRQSCSEYHGGAGVLLDHFVLSGGLARGAGAVESEVAGYCADVSCRPFPSNRPPAAYRSLSDHCPVVLELPDHDDDPELPSAAASGPRR
jgi:endonuclease/exonuclease/phosphatase family metal-dependent hydrolase